MRAKLLLLCAGVAWLNGGLMRAGEQVEFKGSTAVELPKPKRLLDQENRRNDIGSERPTPEGGPAAPPIDSSPLSNKKLREELDKKKNWIYLNPYRQNFDSKTEEFMKGEKSTGLYDNRWMSSDDEKTAVQRFLEERDGRSKDGPDSRGDDKDSPDRYRDRDRDTDDRNNRSPEDGAKLRKDNIPLAGTKSDFETRVLGSGLPELFSSSSLDRNLERNPASENPFAPSKSVSTSVEKEQLKQQQLANERAFDSILQTRLGGMSSSLGQLNGLSAGGEIGRIDLSGGGLRSGVGLPGASLGQIGSSVPSTVTFSDGGASFGARPNIEGPGLGDSFGTIAPKAPAFAPSAATQLPAYSAPTPSATPFSFTVPQRKF